MASVRCLNCGISVVRLRRHAMDDVALDRHRNSLREWIPAVVFDQNIFLCHECFLILDAIPENASVIPDRSFGYADVCLGCGVSLKTHKTITIDENINEIIRAWPHVPRFITTARVCLKCRMKACRHAEKYAKQAADRASPPIPELPAQLSIYLVDFSKLTCLSCCEIMRRRQVNHKCLGCGMPLTNCHGNELALQNRELNDKTQVCNGCSKSYYEMEKGQNNSPSSKEALQRDTLANVNVSIPPAFHGSAAPLQTIRLPNYKRAFGCSEGCLFPNCSMKSFYIIPQYVKQCLLRDYKLYTPEHIRVCREHLISKNWKSIFNRAQSDFTAQQIEDVISILTTNVTRFSFDDIEEIPPNLLLYCTGVNHRQFQNILDKIPSLIRKTKRPVLALTAYLTILRTNYCFDRLSTLFDVKPAILEQLTNTAKACMLKDFIPRYTRVALSSAKTKIARGVTEDDQVFRYLKEQYYADGAITRAHTAMHSSVETLFSPEPSQCPKRENSSDPDEDSLDSDRTYNLLEEEVEINGSIDVLEEAGKFESPEEAEARVVPESSEDEEESEPRVKEELDDVGETVVDREDSDDQHLVYAPKPTEEVQDDPLDTVVVPAPRVEQVKSEEGSVTIKVEPGGGDSQAQPTAGTSQLTKQASFTVYYMKGASNFIRDPGPKLVLEMPH